MDQTLIDDDTLSLSRKSRLPGAGFFTVASPSAAERIAEEEPLEEYERIVVADPDPDGLACVAIIRATRGEALLIPTGPHELRDSLELVAENAHPDLSLYVCDLAPDRAADFAALATVDASVTWFDHHQWPDDLADQVRAAGVDLLVGDSDAECTADVAIRGLSDTVPEHLVELASVTRDHDLWIKDDSRSDDLADYAYWSEPEEYVETVIEHGPDMPPAVQDLLTERRAEKDALIALAIDRARFVDVGSVSVGVTYGRCSQNEVAEGLRQQGADAAVVVKPSGSASIRGSEGFERCHEVAEQVNGGGHPRAAGCKPDIYDDMLDYAHHWVTEGAIAQQTILDAFFDVVDRDEGHAHSSA